MGTDLVVHEGGDGDNRYEVTAASAESMAQTEIQGAITVAKRFPRDELAHGARIVKACARPGLANVARYTFKRGGKTVTGASAPFTREIARMWSNMRWGFYVVSDGGTERTIRAWAWDLENNNKAEQDDSFKKLIQRKDKDSGTTRWVEPDERDLRELTNRRAAIAVRNCLLQLIPKDVVEDALAACDTTLENKVKEDPAGAMKQMLQAFLGLGITGEMLAVYLKHPVQASQPKEIAQLRSIFTAIRDGQATWTDFVEQPGQQSSSRPKTLDDLKDKLKAGDKALPPTPEQLQTIRDLCEEKGVTDDELGGIMAEYGDKLTDLTPVSANAVIEVLRSLGDSR
jgi:hypothetical protein